MILAGTSPVAASPRAHVVEAHGLVKHFPIRKGAWGKRDAVHALDDVSLTIRAGEALGIVGETGSGKSTLARVLLHLTPPDRGTVRFDGIDVTHATGRKLKALRRQMQIVFQDPYSALDPRMKIGTSVAAPLSQHRIGTRSQRRELVRQLLRKVGLDVELADRYPDECSGGQLQRVVIARALSLNPRFLVCDEPTASLDASVRAQILNVIRDLKVELGLTLVLISHDLKVVRHVCDRIAVMYLGQIVEMADNADLFEHPHHPYTRQLLAASLPSVAGTGRHLAVMEGEPPSPINPPTGCRFHEQCPIARDNCQAEAPLLSEVEPQHSVSCFYWSESEITDVPYRFRRARQNGTSGASRN